MKFMLYLNKRGGRIMLTDVKAPDRNEWGSAEDAMIAALDLEKDVNKVSVSCFVRVTASYDTVW
jgi:ferritin heavy chain